MVCSPLRPWRGLKCLFWFNVVLAQVVLAASRVLGFLPLDTRVGFDFRCFASRVFGFVPFHTRVGLTPAFQQRIGQVGFPRPLPFLEKKLRFFWCCCGMALHFNRDDIETKCIAQMDSVRYGAWFATRTESYFRYLLKHLINPGFVVTRSLARLQCQKRARSCRADHFWVGAQDGGRSGLALALVLPPHHSVPRSAHWLNMFWEML